MFFLIYNVSSKYIFRKVTFLVGSKNVIVRPPFSSCSHFFSEGVRKNFGTQLRCARSRGIDWAWSQLLKPTVPVQTAITNVNTIRCFFLEKKMIQCPQPRSGNHMPTALWVSNPFEIRCLTAEIHSRKLGGRKATKLAL